MRSTHTYAVLEVSQTTYNEIRQLLVEAGYQHTFILEYDSEVIDMHGIAIQGVSKDMDTSPVRLLAEHGAGDKSPSNPCTARQG